MNALEKLNVHRTRPILFLLLFLLLLGVFAVPVSASSTSGGGASEAEDIPQAECGLVCRTSSAAS